jgi:hypothetical protein
MLDFVIIVFVVSLVNIKKFDRLMEAELKNED